MPKILKTNWFWMVFAVLTIAFSFTIFSNWTLMICIWFGLFFGFRLAKLESQLWDKEHQIYLATVLIYPVVASAIKWAIVKEIVPYSWFLLNRIEHFIWAVAVAIIFLPTYTNFWKKLRWWQSLTYIIGLVCLLGNLNEFFEYLIRLKMFGIAGIERNTAYYWDTIYDQAINLIGGLVGFILLKWYGKK
jgi:hypothetical protein